MIIKARKLNEETEGNLINGTSYFGNSIYTSIQALRNKFGKESYNTNTGMDSTNIDWHCLLTITDKISFPFTIYDWKEYRVLNDEEETVKFNIGARSLIESQIVHEYLTRIFNKDFRERSVQLDIDVFYTTFKHLFIQLIKQNENFEEMEDKGIYVFHTYTPSSLLKQELKEFIS